MPVQQGKKKVKTDRRDARRIAKCLAHHEYSAVHIPTAKDEETKEYLRMRDDHKLALKKIKQQILSFCLRHGYSYTGGSQNWTKTHLKWLRELKPGGMYQEILEEYLLTYNNLVDKLERMDKRVSLGSRLKPHFHSLQKPETSNASLLLSSMHHTWGWFQERIPVVKRKSNWGLRKLAIVI